MWQRVQTLWWLFSCVAIGLFATQNILLWTPQGELLPKYALMSCGIVSLESATTVEKVFPLAVLSAVSIVLSLVCIFIYKMRTFQFRLSVINCVVLLGMLATTAVFAYLAPATSTVGITVWLSMPLVAFILQLMAIRAVLKDEMLVRMSNRIR